MSSASSYNWPRLRDFHKLIRQRKGWRGTTIPSNTDKGQVWAAEVGRPCADQVNTLVYLPNKRLNLPIRVTFVAEESPRP